MDRGAAERALPGQLILFDEAPPACDAAPGAQRRLIRLAGRVIEYRFARRRRRTIGITVDATGLRVSAPRRAPWGEIEAFVREKQHWIVARLDAWAHAGSPAPLFGVSGETLPLFGEPVVLDVSQGRLAVALECGRLRIAVPEPQRRGVVREALTRWLRGLALAALAPRTAHYAARLGLPPPRLAISNARSLWGVCMQSGAIRLSWRLAHLAPQLADYVVAHEVAHLVELNHSKRFWKLVQTLYPDWRAARIELASASLPQL